MDGTDVDLGHARAVAVRAAEAAGALIRAGVARGVDVRPKGGASDVVTDLDVDAEELILGRIRAAFPDHRIVAEESGVSGLDGHPWSWLVDPLDGTNNLAVGLSTYVVGVALCRRRRPVLGVVHEPVSGSTWSATRGGGVLGPPPPAPQDRGSSPIVAWTQGHGVSRADPAACALKLALETSSRRVLQLWAPLLGWVMLVRGQIDGVVGYRAEAVDLPAGALLAQEAGMVLRTLSGAPFDDRIGGRPDDRCFVAAPPDRVDGLVALARAAGGLEDPLRDLRRRITVPQW